MIRFFRDILNGPLYIIIAILSIVFIMAIIGFLLERKKIEQEERDKVAVINNTVTPIPNIPVTNVVSLENEVKKPLNSLKEGNLETK